MGIFPKNLLNLNYVFPLNLFNLQKSINKILLYASKDIREDDAPNFPKPRAPLERGVFYLWISGKNLSHDNRYNL